MWEYGGWNIAAAIPMRLVQNETSHFRGHSGTQIGVIGPTNWEIMDIAFLDKMH